MAKQRFLLPKPDTQLTLFAMCPLMLSGIGRNDAARHNHQCQELHDFFCHVAVMQQFAMARMDSGDPVSLEELMELLPSALVMRFPADNGTAAKCIKIFRQLVATLQHNAVEYLHEITPEMLDDFFWMATRKNGFHEPSSATAALRQWCCRTVLALLVDMGLWEGGDITGPTISREHGRSTRPMTDSEINQIQVMSHNVLVPNGDEILLALALCGGSASEIAGVFVEDIDIESSMIHFYGHSERLNPIDEWSLDVLREAVGRIAESSPIVVRPGLPLARASHSVTVRLNRMVSHAGFASATELTGASIRLGAAYKMFSNDGLESAARFLGNQSLDATAKALRYDWWAQN